MPTFCCILIFFPNWCEGIESFIFEFFLKRPLDCKYFRDIKSRVHLIEALGSPPDLWSRVWWASIKALSDDDELDPLELRLWSLEVEVIHSGIGFRKDWDWESFEDEEEEDDSDSDESGSSNSLSVESDECFSSSSERSMQKKEKARRKRGVLIGPLFEAFSSSEVIAV